MEEPTVLDYIKSKLNPWKSTSIEIPSMPAEELPVDRPLLQSEDQVPSTPDRQELLAPHSRPRLRLALPWRSILAFLLACAAQRAFGPPGRDTSLGGILLLLSIAWTAWAVLKGEWILAEGEPGEVSGDASVTDLAGSTDSEALLKVRAPALGVGALCAAGTFLASGDNRFSWLSLGLLTLSVLSFGQAFWWDQPRFSAWVARLVSFLRRPRWTISLSRWALTVAAATLLVLFFRFYRLDTLPSEMVSDHAEKYLDVMTILNGYPQIFFPRNGGREALQFYLLAAMIKFFGASMSHLTLKISTALVGVLALPFIYLLGKEIGNRRVGLLAFTLAGVSYWGNVVSRAGMRLPFYFLFTAALLYFLVRGLRRGQRNDFIFAGIVLGLGFYGYSADRILPLIVVVASGLYIIHTQSVGRRKTVIWWTVMLAMVSFVIFLPLLRYVLMDPEGFSYRMASRMGTMEQPLPGPAWQIFLDNLWRALIMFSWSSGVVWGVSIPDYPALGMIAGGLFYIGTILVLLRYLRRRHWLDIFLVLSIPLLMLPSILALAFPSENPNLYRTGGALIPVFLLVAFGLDALLGAIERVSSRFGIQLAWTAGLILVGLVALQDYDLVFNKFDAQYRLSAWNTSEIGQVIRDFSETTLASDNAWVMGYPHWVDTRLVALNAGIPEREYAMFVENLENTRENPNAKLFIINPLDSEALTALQNLYPDGWVQTFDSAVETKDFLMYFVPPNGN